MSEQLWDDEQVQQQVAERMAELEAENAALHEEAIESAIHDAGMEYIEEAQVAAYDENTRLRAENARLRGLLPGPEVRAVLNELLADARLSPFHEANRYDLDTVREWLDRVSVAQRRDELEAAGELEGEASDG